MMILMKQLYSPLVIGLVSLWLLSTLTACSQEKDANIWPMNSQCDLHQQACVTQSAEQSVRLKLLPNPVPIARPLTVEVNLKHIEAESVKLDISGINMYMGYNRIQLATPNNQDWFGTSMLAFCTNEVMEWQITVMITQKDGTELQVPYKLVTRNR